jgi:hypothetical protein
LKLGVRESRRAEQLTEAASSVRGIGTKMEALINLLARSRKVEIDIIASQFGPLIDPTRLAQLRKDLDDLEATLKLGVS